MGPLRVVRLAAAPVLGLLSVAGCQYIAQLNGLDGVGGAGSSSSSHAVTSSGAGGGHVTSSGGPTTSTSAGGVPCGFDAGGCQADMCPSCNGPICAPECNTTACPMKTIHAENGPTAMQCSDSTCVMQTFTCSGSYLCELDCTAVGACAGTKLICADGPCRLHCDMMACGMPVTVVECGSNDCDIQYYAAPGTGGGVPASQKGCPNECGCTHEDLAQ